MISEYDVVSVLNEFGMPVYAAHGQIARLSDNQVFVEEPARLKQGQDVSEQDQLREFIKNKLEKLGIEGRTYIAFRDPAEVEAGENKITFVFLGFLQQTS